MLCRFSGLLALMSVVVNFTISPPAYGQEKQTLAWPPAALRFPQVTRDGEASSNQNPMTLSAFPLDQIGETNSSLFEELTFGDTDHDGRNEVILYHQDMDFSLHYQILEEQGNNAYSLEYSGASLIVYATGDLDMDGKSEIIGQDGSRVQVYESLDATSHPTELVWSSAALSPFTGYTTIGDTDRDGRMEIIHSLNTLSGSTLLIFENTGDNSFALVCNIQLGRGTGEKVIADLDGDGLIEIALSALDSVYIVESPADNVWNVTWRGATGLGGSSAAEGGVDTDGNGKPELFIMGNGPNGFTTIVFEAVSNNIFTSVDTIAIAEGGLFGGVFNALGNLDGLGTAGYFMEGLCCLWVYQATSPGNWELVQTITDPTPPGLHDGLHIYDVNQNGRDELFWTTSAFTRLTVILEHPGVITDAQETRELAFGALRIFPNPCRVEAQIQFISNPEIQRLSVYDVAGRVVQRRLILGGRSPVLNAKNLAAGVYLIRMEDERGGPISRGRVTVIK